MKTSKLLTYYASLALALFFVLSTAKADITMDNTDASGVTITGTWTAATTTPGYYGTNYIHDGNTGKGTKTVRYTPNITVPGNYYVYARWPAASNRATNAPITVQYDGGTTGAVPYDQTATATSNTWVLLGYFPFATGSTGYVEIGNTGTTGYVCADAVKFSMVPPAPTGLLPMEADTQVGLSWTASPAATGYNVKRSSTTGGPYTTIASNLTDVNYLDTDLTNGTPYYYVVTAVNAAGEGDQTAQVGATPTNLPNPWLTQDIGAVGATGNVSFNAGTYTVAGAGPDIASTSDQFRYVYQPETGNCTVSAHVASVSNTDPAAKAGVMIRETMNSNSMFAAVVVTPGSGVIFIRRPSTGAAVSTTAVTGVTAPVWLQLIRTGSSFTAWRSTTGLAGSWTQIGVTSNFTTFASTANLGMAVASKVSATLCTGTFDNLSPGATAPVVPTNLTATAITSGQIDLNWTDTFNETGYKIERSTSSAPATFVQIGTSAADSPIYHDTTVSPSTTYYYRIRANNATGDSGYTGIVSATTPTAGPTAPSNITFGTTTSTSIVVNWTSNSGGTETGFKIERSTTGLAGSWSQINTVGTGVTQYPDSGLSPFTTYYYQVRAYNAGGNSAYTAPANTKTLDVAPAAPSAVTINTTTHPATSNTMTIDWTDNSNGASGNETSFKIERKTGAGSFAYIATVGANVTEWTDSSVASATSYGYRVSAVNGAGTSTTSATASNGTTLGTAISAPSAPTLTVDSATQITIGFTANATNSTVIERSTTGAADDFHPVTTIAPGATASYQDNVLTQGTTYFYRIRTNSGTNNSSYVAAAASVSTLLATPTNLTITQVSPTSVSLTWTDNATGEAGFRVENKIGVGGAYNTLTTAPANSVLGATVQYSSGGLTADTTYYYHVRAGGTPSTNSPYTADVPVTTLPTPVLKASAVSGTQINLDWTPYTSANETGFKIERKPDVGGSWSQINTTLANVTTYNDTTVSANSSYIYRVRATVAGSNDGLYSNQANATTWFGGALPSPWANGSVGSPNPAGNASYSSGTYGIQGAGTLLASSHIGMPSADSFDFMYQPLSGDGTIVARVVSMDKTDAWACAGVMIRDTQTLTTTSNYAMMALSAGYAHGSSFAYRTAAGKSDRFTPEDGVSAPYWVKLIRSGSLFTAYKSADNVTWVKVSSLTVPMGTNVYAGLVVTSKIGGVLNKTKFDNVSFTAGGVTTAPAAPGYLPLSGITSSAIQVNWSDLSGNETGFSVERKTGATGTYAVIATPTAGAVSYNDTGLAPGTYYYRVQSYNAGGYSAYTTEAGATTTGAPAASYISQGKTATSASGTPSLAFDGDLTTYWQPADGYPQSMVVDLGASYSLNRAVISWYFPDLRWYTYTIDGSVDGSTYFNLVTHTAQVIPHGDTRDVFTATTARYVKVTVTGSNATGSPNTRIFECKLYRVGSEPTAADTLATGTVTTNTIPLSWVDRSTNETGFKVERKTSATGIYTQIATVPSTTTGTTGTTINFTDTGLSPGIQYFYRVLAYSTTDGDALDYAPLATAPEISATTTTGGSFTRAYWTGVSGGDVADLTAWQVSHPTPTNQATLATSTLNTLEAPTNWGDNYGQEIYGYVHPPATGSYTFYVSSDNSSELWFSTNPADTIASHPNAAVIANMVDSTTPRNYADHTSNAQFSGLTQKSATVSLTAGNNYYIMLRHKEGTNTFGKTTDPDHASVAWEGPGFTRQILSDTGLTQSSSITSPSNGATFTEGSNITINASATAATGRSIVKVEFLLNGDSKIEAKLGEDTSAPYSFTWNGVAAGSYVLSERAWDDAGVSTTSSVKVMVTNSSFGSGTWTDRILNGDGTINLTEYANVASNYDRRDMVEYRFGPTYAYYHPGGGTFHTLVKETGEDGLLGHLYLAGFLPPLDYLNNTDWYSESGQMVFSPNASASAAAQSGVAQAVNGDVYTYSDPVTPIPYCFIYGIEFTNQNEPSHGQSLPDPSVRTPAFIAANLGTVPPPVATVRTGELGGISGFLIFKNGWITATGNGATDGYSGDYGFTQLASNKMPTAAAVTPNNEFLLVTVWDTSLHKGQVAVVALDGQFRAQQTANSNGWEQFIWGMHSRFKVMAMKVLGYVDTPTGMVAPSSISASTDYVAKDGVGAKDNDNLVMLLDSQDERDTWMGWSGSVYKRTPKSGYAIVASRAEKKVAFLDLQPLFEYYRQMYFTTQANYDLTKNQGSASNQWPYTFSYVSSQMPTWAPIDGTVSGSTTLSLSSPPTAVMAGLPRNPNGGNNSTGGYLGNAYIATMDGHLYIYNIGDLITPVSNLPALPASPITLNTTINIGNNPTSFDFNVECGVSMVINCRGDKAIYMLNSAGGTSIPPLTDSRIQDPVYAALSQNGRRQQGTLMVHVMDFEGSQIHTYRFGSTTSLLPPILLPSGESGDTGFEFGFTDPVPGCPIMYTRCGIN